MSMIHFIVQKWDKHIQFHILDFYMAYRDYNYIYYSHSSLIFNSHIQEVLYITNLVACWVYSLVKIVIDIPSISEPTGTYILP